MGYLKNSFRLFLVLWIILSFASIQKAKTIETEGQLYEAALFKKEGRGDLDGAIKIFFQIVEKYPDNREIAAKAQLQIGLCYEKLGLKKAQKAYQKVIDNYPLQSGEVRAAKERLSNLLKVRSSEGKNKNEFKIEVVWPKPKWGIEGSLSPDGRYLSFVDWDTGDLAYRDLASGKTYRLTDLASHPERQESAYDSFWSPDSRQIAYCWENDLEKYYDIRVMRLGSKKPHTLFRGGYYDVFIQPCGWTPDGKHILVRLIEKRKRFKFGLLSVADDSLRIIKELDLLARWNRPGFIQFSPDGQYIAYDFQQNVETPHHDIYILSSDGKINSPLAAHPAHDYFLGWAPDGKRIFFASERTGTVDLWIVSVEKGKQNGDPVLLSRNIGSIKPLGILQDGSFFFNTGKGEVPFDIHTATIDSGTGGILSSPKKLTLPYQGNNFSPSWSPDGEYIAYISRRGVMNKRTLCIYSVKTGRIRTILYKSDVGHPHWAPDGRSILVRISEKGIFKVNVQTEKFISVVRPKIEQKKKIPIAAPNMSSDNNLIFYAYRDNIVTHVMVRDLKTEKEKELYSSPFFEHDMVLSPDGQNLALLISENPYENKIKKHMLKILPVAGGDVREVCSFKQVGSWGLVDIAWSPDGKHVYFSKISPEQKSNKLFDWELWRVSADGGQAEKTGLKLRGYLTLSIHPDGQQIVWSSHNLGIEPAPEVWVMKNFLPGKKK